MTITYDGDGNRITKTLGGLTTKYLVDTNSPTGYAQVLEELNGSTVTRKYTYGLSLIDENQNIGNTATINFYGFDGHGSVRQLTDRFGNVTDTYTYDAFGNLLTTTGSTPNNFKFTGEQFDPDSASTTTGQDTWMYGRTGSGAWIRILDTTECPRRCINTC